MAQVYNLRHEGGDWSEYLTSGASPSFAIAGSAALGTGNFGIVIDFDQSPGASLPTYVSGSDFDTTSSTARFGFRYNLNNVAMSNNADSIILLYLEDGLGYEFLQVEVVRTAASVFRMDFYSSQDAAVAACISASGIPRGTDTTVELSWARPTGSAASDGTFAAYVNNVLEDQQTNLDNFDSWLKIDDSSFRLLIDHNEVNGTGTVSGQFHLDEITLRDDSTQIFGTTLAFRLLGLAADSGRIYATGLEDTASLILYDYSLADLSEGASPSSFGAATNAGINAASYGIFPVTRPGNDAYIYLRGRDANDVKTQKFNYDDAATGWTDIGAGSATWDASKMAVGLHPSIFDPDDLMAAFTDNSVYRTRDEGTTWTSQGSTTGSLLSSARHPVDDNKIFVGGCQPGTLDYSHNYGKTFSAIDLTGVAASRDHRVLASGDDGFVAQSASLHVNNTTVTMGNESGFSGDEEAWFRFSGVAIASSAIINSAYIQFEANQLDSGSLNLIVYGENADNPTAASSLSDFNGRTRTSASVAWSPSDPWTAGCTYTTPNISIIVQEIVNRSGWTLNNAMQFFIEFSAGADTERVAKSFDSASNLAPLLHIESTGSGGVINHIEVSL